ncbi:hypothetical protein ABDK56_11505 [Sphingomonas sp. ASV193]|uniref:hypothetical protein n=1 Tax=Sphingomonas sp. ASV193 TaxID=3144405 RepID=UPI0032E878B1
MLLIFAAAVAAAAGTPETPIARVDQGEVHASFIASPSRDGERLIAGRYDDGRAFVYRVRADGLVRGTVGSDTVEFRMARR